MARQGPQRQVATLQIPHMSVGYWIVHWQIISQILVMYTETLVCYSFKSTSSILFTHILLSPLLPPDLPVLPCPSCRRWQPGLVSVWRVPRATTEGRRGGGGSRLPRGPGGECPVPLRARARRGGLGSPLWPGRGRRCQVLRRKKRPRHLESRAERDRGRGRRLSHKPLLPNIN